MKNKRIISLLILIFSVFNFISCEKSTSNATIDLFDGQKALNISKDYLFNIKNGNIEAANKLCSEELLNETVNKSKGISEITSFSKDKTIQGKDFGYYIYNVIRTSSIEPKSDLESFIIKVQKVDDSYVISEVKAQSQKELFVKGSNLRILEDGGSNSNVVINLNSIPKDTYSSDNKIMLYKSEVPNDSFGRVCLSFTGKKIAISTIGNDSIYLCVANIEDSVTTFIDEASVQENDSNNATQIEELLEKPIAEKIISLDLLKNSTVNNFIFSNKEESLAVSYTNGNGVNRINLYNVNEGGIISQEIDKEFNKDQFNIEEIGFNEEEFVFTAKSVNSENKDKEGKYSFNIESHQIKKL